MKDTRAYSGDLRHKVISYICAGHQQYEAASLFKVSRPTVSRWYKIYQEEGRTNPLQRQGRKPTISKEELEEYIHKNPDSDLCTIAEHFSMSTSGIHDAMKRVGIVYKKNFFVHRSRPRQACILSRINQRYSKRDYSIYR